MISNIIAVLTNTFLNWVFIYGNLGAPAMGVRGAGHGDFVLGGHGDHADRFL